MSDRDVETEGGISRLRLLSYNIHRCIDREGRSDVTRIAGVIRSLAPDLVALQEVENSHGRQPESQQLDYLAAATGLYPFGGPTLHRRRGDYGNGLLSRLPLERVRRIDLSYSGREPRGALDAEISLDDERRIRVIVTHLGLRPAERRFQVNRLVEALEFSATRPVVLMGDLNEWLPLGRPYRWLHRHFGNAPTRRTFPAAFPLLPLDRILVNPQESLVHLETVDNPITRRASDHLPLLAEVEVSPSR